jgi:hypothetical protein
MRAHTVLLFGCLALGCIGVSESQRKDCIPQAGAAAGGTVAPAAKACAKGVRIAADGTLDDFEDGDSQVSKIDVRDGYWWKSKDDKGSTIEPDKLTPEEAGPGGNGVAAHFSGTTSSTPGAWGALFGANFVASGSYDASKYVGLVFKAKVGPKSTKKVRLKVGDVNTHPDGGVCKSCWNHFGMDLTLTTEWKEYQVLFADLKQAPGWGDPKPPGITVAQLHSIDWSIGTGATFDIWVDDIAFLECQ